MANSTVTLTVNKTGCSNGGTQTASVPPITNTAAPDTEAVYAFTGGTFATIAIPAGATGVLITVPSSNTGAVTLKGVTGDTGTQLCTTGGFSCWLPLGSGAVLGFLLAVTGTLEVLFT